MIPEHIVDEIRVRADIVDIVGEQIPLKRAGKDFRALCPFHHEKTPSFYVVPAKGLYHCFGCQESGDVFTFLMKRGGLTFQDAVRELGGRVGVEVPDTRGGRQEDEPNRAIYEVVAFADDFFRRGLESDAGARARKYLEERGIPAEAVERFGLGYAPDGWRGLREEAHRHDIDDEVLILAGLIKESDRGDEPYDRFRDRLIFPIAELGGRTVAFGGRVLGRAGQGVPKYLNSPETPIYHKGRLLYGLNRSRSAIRREGVALLVEGYMDYVSLAARGIENVVAGMGTALTMEQANLLARYAGKAMLLYDSDRAGQGATFRTADALLQAGVHPLVVTLPENQDPDSVVRRGGAPALKECLDGAVDVLERKLAMLDERGFFEDIEGVRRALDRLLPTLRATVDPALRDIYISRIATRTGVRRETLEQELVRSQEAVAAAARARRAPREEAPAVRERHAAERLLLMVLLTDPARIADARTYVAPGDLHEPRHRQIYEALLESGSGADLRLGSAAAALADDLRRQSAEILDANNTLADAISAIELQRLDLEYARIEAEWPDADEPRRIELLREKALVGQKHRGLTERAVWRAGRRQRQWMPHVKRPSPQPDD